MTKFIKIMQYIKKHRKNGIASFRVVTTASEFIIYNQLRLNYK